MLSLDDIGCDEDIPETATTIEDNALLKVQYIQNTIIVMFLLMIQV